MLNDSFGFANENPGESDLMNENEDSVEQNKSQSPGIFTDEGPKVAILDESFGFGVNEETQPPIFGFGSTKEVNVENDQPVASFGFGAISSPIIEQDKEFVKPLEQNFLVDQNSSFGGFGGVSNEYSPKANFGLGNSQRLLMNADKEMSYLDK